MKSLAAAVLVTFAIGCGGGADQAKARDLCKKQLALICNKTLTCPALAARQTMYTSEDDCNAKTSPDCDGPTTCLSGTYHADKDQQCLEAMQALTCSQLEDGTASLLPPVCVEVCTVP